VETSIILHRDRSEDEMLMWLLKQVFDLDKGLGVDPNG
jgi:hypothetical protein